MEQLIALLINNYNLQKNEINIAKKLCDNENLNIDKCIFVINNLIRYKLDLYSIFAFLSYESKVDVDIDDKDFLFVLESLKVNTQISKDMSREQQVEILRKMFIAMNNDVRILIIRLCIILYDISCYTLPLTKEQHDNLIDVREIFAPLAERLGLNSIKSMLEDFCLKFLNPKIFEELENSVMLKQEENDKQIEITTKKLQQIIDDLGLKNAVIMARRKHFSSIYKKLTNKNVTLANIYDLIAMRVIVDTVEECYAVLGKIHSIYKPMQGRFKDYIASPKANNYQSLHTTIIVENLRPMEVQIRTHEMHKNSEFGVFAHWLYKEKRVKRTELDLKMSWLREIMESSKDLTPNEFIETLKTNLCEGRIFVQTPKGKVLEFVEGSTILDFAYAIHTDIGNNCVGGKINGKIKPISSALKNGDIVEIITNPNSKGPSRDWLKIVKSAQAKSKINSFFKKELREENVKAGINYLELAIKSKGYNPSKVMIDKYLNPSNFKYVFNTKEELFASIGYGSVPVNNVSNRIIDLYNQDNKIEISKQSNHEYMHIRKNKDGVLIDGDSGMLIRYAGCCSPVYGEEIVGYISRGRGVTIHRADCQNIKYLEPERLINAVWDENSSNRSTSTLIKVIAEKNDNFIVKITQNITNAGFRIIGLECKENNNNKIICIVKTEVSKKDDLPKIISIIKEIPLVEDVFRMGKI